MGLKIDHRAQKITKIILAILLIAVILCMLKILIWENSYYQNKSAEERSPEQTVITDLANVTDPSEEEPTESDIVSYQVSSTAPRYLIIKRLGIKARVKDSNVNEHILPVPDNIYDASWYSGSSRPGQEGNILISGIAEGATKHGIFYNLDSLEQDDVITLERGDGEKFDYAVKKISIVDKKDAKQKLPEAQKRINDKETLTLFTARRTNEDDENFNSIFIIQANKK